MDVLEMEVCARDAIRSVTGLAALLGIDALDASSRCATVRPSLTEEFGKKQQEIGRIMRWIREDPLPSCCIGAKIVSAER